MRLPDFWRAPTTRRWQPEAVRAISEAGQPMNSAETGVALHPAYEPLEYSGHKWLFEPAQRADGVVRPSRARLRAVSGAEVADLNRLAYRYAAAVDTCDVEGFLHVFHPDARLRAYHPEAEEPFADAVGHEQLASIPPRMREMFRCTAHQMTNHLVDVDGDSATGTLLCTARHLSIETDAPTALIVVIRYVDRYERRAGTWRILDRQIRFLWSERHDVVESGLG